MGLDATHDCWHGAYSAFKRWREKLAEVAGYEVVELDTYPFRDIDIEWPENLKFYQGEWEQEEYPEDPLLFLLIHSDCDGYLYPQYSNLIADRLEELLPKLEGIEESGGHIGSYADKTKQFIKGLRLAHRHNEKVTFA